MHLFMKYQKHSTSLINQCKVALQRTRERESKRREKMPNSPRDLDPQPLDHKTYSLLLCYYRQCPTVLRCLAVDCFSRVGSGACDPNACGFVTEPTQVFSGIKRNYYELRFELKIFCFRWSGSVGNWNCWLPIMLGTKSFVNWFCWYLILSVTDSIGSWICW